jgi:type IV pilus assembly protein PilB
MKIGEKILKKILVDSKIIPSKTFDIAKKEAVEKKLPLEDVFINKGIISDKELGKLIADEIKLPFVNLKNTKIKREVLEIIPEIVAKEQKIISFEKTKEGLKVAMADPDNLEIREFLERKTGEKVIPFYATKRDIKSSLKYYKKEIKEEFEDIIGKSIEEFEKVELKAPHALPIIRIVDLILNYGYENRASDIHIEPYPQKTILRYRIDGILHDVLTLPKEIHDFLVSRIKILSKLRTDEHEAAQDGHFSFRVPEEEFDVRVSIVPIERGEKVVMRLLAERAKRFQLEELGLTEDNLRIVEDNLKKTFGMILASGPTGCGKTTTLYAMLRILNTRQVNIMTIEDPIEYDMEGVNQIQVNPKTNLTFAQGLKSIVRQDPNIIMVGEIRDKETAKLATNAAMTGHLVLSTFHAIDAPTVLTRLEDMEIEPYLIATTVNIAIAQRLVRKICPNCIESHEVPFSKVKGLIGQNLAAKFSQTEGGKTRLFKGKGCGVCQSTGFLGRIGIFEVLEMTEPIKNLVLEKAPASRIKQEAVRLGMRTMLEDGIEKVKMGLTTLEEVIKTTQ